MNLAALLDAVPVVQSSADRAVRFPTPATDQRVYNKTTGFIERWTGAAWAQEIPLLAGTALTLPGPVSVVGDITAQARLLFSAAVSKIVPGATSLAVRDSTDAFNNLLLANNGDATVRNRLLLALAAAKIIGGATSLSLRNAADSADNLLVTDAGRITLRSGAALGGVLYRTGQSIASPAGSPATIASFVLTGGTLAQDGQSLRLRAWGTFANNANAKAVRVNIGGALFTLNATASTNNRWWIDFQIAYRAAGASAQPFGAWIAQGLTTPTQFPIQGTNVLDFSANQTVALDCTQVAAGDVVLESMTAEVLP